MDYTVEVEVSPLQAKSEKSLLLQSIWLAEGCFLCCGWHPFVRFKVRMDLALSRHSLRSSTWVMEVAVNLWVRVKLPEIITELEGVIWICDHYIQTIKMKCFMIFQWSCNMSYLFFKLESLGHSVWPLPDKTSWQTAAVCPGLTEDSSENLEIHLLTLECKMCVRLTQPFFFFLIKIQSFVNTNIYFPDILRDYSKCWSATMVISYFVLKKIKKNYICTVWAQDCWNT